jgi:hypothetical protein
MKRRILGICVVVVWGAALAFGMHTAMRYDSTPGKPGDPDRFEAPQTGKAWTCVMVAHPLCPCTRSSLKALREVATRFGDRASFHIVFAGERPGQASENMELAELVPGAKVEWTSSQDAAKTYGSYTSGQVFLYDSRGKTVFAGGLTPARGTDQPLYAVNLFENVFAGKVSESPVFGCPLQEATP